MKPDSTIRINKYYTVRVINMNGTDVLVISTKRPRDIVRISSFFGEVTVTYVDDRIRERNNVKQIVKYLGIWVTTLQQSISLRDYVRGWDDILNHF